MRHERLFNRPLYQQVRDDLARRIATGAWKTGDTLPNEHDLARELGVSPGTMRRSLDLLESEHLIIRRQGRGSFVKDPRHQVHRFNRMRSADGTPVGDEAKALDVSVEQCNGLERARLQLDAGARVYRIHRTRSHLGKIFMFEVAALPAVLFPGLEERSLPSHRLIDIAHAYCLLLGNAEERISLETPSPAAAEALNLASGTTHVLQLDRVIRSRDDQPLEWRRAECASLKMHYLAEIN
jgi:GntR family transcriptional regulator